ncbi:class I SAM-dependent methyltransferase [Actinophytocola oryzae]|uniref:Methyltransferase family protein n=1 Tax=Actinophytocola oryzae TaxID=502181 RepID=A0A4R7VYG9_9PSEU|nr:class I SAM-dependent methyltransferase [Actinophytocola oryzae]TDV55114.1 methyltransferase family protein [Actinophytocola oryzae]
MTSTEESRRKYDALADRYEDIFFYVADVGRRLVEYATPPPGARLLDVGAGRGAVARAALARGCAVTAVDSSAGMVSRLAEDYPEMLVRQQDAGALGFTDGAFDVVTSGFVVQVLTSPQDALAEFRRVLAPGGVVAISLERQEIGRLRWLHELNKEFFGGGGGSPMTADELDALLLSAGFTSPTRVTVDIPKPLADPAALWDWMAEQGVADAVNALPTERAVAFREGFFRGAEEMHRDGGISITFGATLHRAVAP